MNKLNFWRNWSTTYRSIYKVLLFVFCLSIVLSLYSQFNSYDMAFPKDIARKTQSIELSLHDVQDFVFDVKVPDRSYVIFQSFLSLNSGFEPVVSYVLLGIVLCCFSVLMTVATYLSRWWFIIFQSVVVVWLITLKLQFLNIFGLDSQLLTFGFVGLILLVGYYFHAFKEGASLLKRWLSFAAILIAMVLVVYFGSSVEAPLVFMMHHGIIVPVILAIIFIFNVAYDIVLHILYLLASKKTNDGSSNLSHFIIISMLYLIYVGLTFAKNDNLLKIDMIYLDEFLLLSLSAILGVWGFKKRSELFGDQLIFRPLGAYAYLAMGVLTFSVLAWIFINANDPLVDTFEDMIIFSHLGFGVLFFVYVLYNFVGLLNSGLGIYPVVFRPVNIPYNLVRGVGFGLVIILILRSSYLPYYQAVSGYYIGLADYYEHIGEKQKALTTYKIARQYAVTSHKHNFEIAKREYEAQKWAEASAYFSNANTRRPSVQAYLNKVQTQLNANLIFEALFTLEEAQQAFPDDAYILNMKALIYERLNQLDSSFIYFDAAERAAQSAVLGEVAASNKLALFAKNAIDEQLSEQADLKEKSVAYQANYLAFANRKRANVDSLRWDAEELPELLTYNDFSLLFNFTLNKSITHKAFQADTISWLAKIPENGDFRKSLNYATAARLNYSGSVKNAYSLIYELENDNISDAGFYYLLHGLWLMDQQDFKEAARHFSKATDLKISKARTYHVIALVLEGRLFEAAKKYQQQLKAESISAQVVDTDPLYQFLLGNPAKLPESFKYLWLKTNSSLQMEEKDSIRKELEGSPFLTLLELNEIEQQIKEGLYAEAKKRILEVTVSQAEKGLWLYRNNLLALVSAITDDQQLSKEVVAPELATYPYNYKLLWEIRNLREKKKTSTEVDLKMEKLGKDNPYFEAGILYTAHYFNSKDDKEMAYDVLVEASRLNPNSTELLKAYTLQALQLNLESYAEESYEELSEVLSESEWQLFSQKYERIRKEVNEEAW